MASKEMFWLKWKLEISQTQQLSLNGAIRLFSVSSTAWKVSRYFWSIFSCIRTEYGDLLQISVFSPNTGNYGPEKTPYLDTSCNDQQPHEPTTLTLSMKSYYFPINTIWNTIRKITLRNFKASNLAVMLN